MLVYYGIKILSRIFAPALLRYVTKKAEKQFGQQFNQNKRPEPNKKEGDVVIDKVPDTKTSNKNVGEYVDYEEID
jgi:hypothetical protein